jgi:hypothetical protein
MSMLALPEYECQEILAMFRQHLANVPDAWLQELAANYGLDAVVDIDPSDVIAILSVPGELHRIQTLLTQREPIEKTCSRIRDELEARGIDQRQISSRLLIIQDSSAKLPEIGALVQRVAVDDGDGVKKGWAWYAPSSNLRSIYSIWIVVCSTLSDVHPSGSRS